MPHMVGIMDVADEWRAAREETKAVEVMVESMHGPLCMMLGEEPRALTLEDLSCFVRDIGEVEEMARQALGPQQMAREAWARLQGSIQGVRHLAPSQGVLELEWQRDNVSWEEFVQPGGAEPGDAAGGRSLKVGDETKSLIHNLTRTP